MPEPMHGPHDEHDAAMTMMHDAAMTMMPPMPEPTTMPMFMCDAQHGGIPDPSHSVCCPMECGTCGGGGCGRRPGGAHHCCKGTIMNHHHHCGAGGTGPPCVI